MQTPDGQEFKRDQASDQASKAVRAAAEALASAALLLLRALWKLIITTWRLAAALDSALWRATKLLARKAVNGLFYVMGLALEAFQSPVNRLAFLDFYFRHELKNSGVV